MFNLQTFMNQVNTDNTKYERWKQSSLHDVVDLLTNNQPPFGPLFVAQLATELKKIKRSKPAKLTNRYHNSYQYLLGQIPGLRDAMRGNVVNFHTTRMDRNVGGGIDHYFAWESDTGDLTELAHLVVREYVTWAAPTVPAQYIIPVAPLEDYTQAGWHAGQGNRAHSQATSGGHHDGHGLLGPFAGAVLGYTGQNPLVYTFNQVYQFGDKQGNYGANWADIPMSNYTIVREVHSLGGQRIRVKITKTNVNRPGDTKTNEKSLP